MDNIFVFFVCKMIGGLDILKVAIAGAPWSAFHTDNGVEDAGDATLTEVTSKELQEMLEEIAGLWQNQGQDQTQSRKASSNAEFTNHLALKTHDLNGKNLTTLVVKDLKVTDSPTDPYVVDKEITELELNNIYFPNNTLRKNEFDIPTMESLILPDSIKTIKTEAISSNNLHTIRFGKNILNIEDGAFKNIVNENTNECILNRIDISGKALARLIQKGCIHQRKDGKVAFEANDDIGCYNVEFDGDNKMYVINADANER